MPLTDASSASIVKPIVVTTAGGLALCTPNRYRQETIERAAGHTLVAPASFPTEVTHRILTQIEHKILAPEIATQCMNALLAMPVALFPVAPLLRPAWDLVHANGLAISSALDQALAADLGCPILAITPWAN